MAEVARGEQNLLTSKWGPLPVWVWALVGLVAAWLLAKWRDSRSGTSKDSGEDDAGATGAESESEAVAPQFIIENNMPATPVGAGAPPTPSAPVTPPPSVPPPVVTLPGTTPNPPRPKPTTPAKKPPAKKKEPIHYKVKHGDTLSAIAKKYHTSVDALWKYNTTAGNRPAATIATLKKRGKNLLYAGETILIPQ